MSEIVKDEMVKPMDRAVWNIEHVIKFSKWKHLRYHGHDISLIDYYGTFVVLILPLIILLYCVYLALSYLKTNVSNIRLGRVIPFGKQKAE